MAGGAGVERHEAVEIHFGVFRADAAIVVAKRPAAGRRVLQHDAGARTAHEAADAAENHAPALGLDSRVVNVADKGTDAFGVVHSLSVSRCSTSGGG